MTASGRHHTSLLWLMTDGASGQAPDRLPLGRVRPRRRDGGRESCTCGIGIRASASAPGSDDVAVHRARAGRPTCAEDDAGPLSKPRLQGAVESDGQRLRAAPRAYKEHVGPAAVRPRAARSTTTCCGCSTGCASRRSARTSTRPGSPSCSTQALPAARRRGRAPGGRRLRRAGRLRRADRAAGRRRGGGRGVGERTRRTPPPSWPERRCGGRARWRDQASA